MCWVIGCGYGPKAQVTLPWMRKLWRWSFERDLVDSPIMDAVKVEYEKQGRDRVYTDDEIITIRKAADQLNPVEQAYVKLLALLAPRKTALALMCRTDLDNCDNPTLWTTPHEHTKARKKSNKKKVYLTPLPLLAQRLVKGLLRPAECDRLFPGLPIYLTRAQRPWFDGHDLTAKLIEHGAPKDFSYHAFRHTVATFLENAGHSEWERGLIQNHSGSASVTAGYSHGYPLELKRAPLTKWAHHVEQLVTPEGVSRLR